MSTRARRLAVAFIAAACATVAWYAVLRVGQHLAYGEPDPAAVIYSEHAAYFWRIWTASFLGIANGFAASLAGERRVVRILPAAIVVATALLVLQSVFVP